MRKKLGKWNSCPSGTVRLATPLLLLLIVNHHSCFTNSLIVSIVKIIVHFDFVIVVF